MSNIVDSIRYWATFQSMIRVLATNKRKKIDRSIILWETSKDLRERKFNKSAEDDDRIAQIFDQKLGRIWEDPENDNLIRAYYRVFDMAGAYDVLWCCSSNGAFRCAQCDEKLVRRTPDNQGDDFDVSPSVLEKGLVLWHGNRIRVFLLKKNECIQQAKYWNEKSNKPVKPKLLEEIINEIYGIALLNMHDLQLILLRAVALRHKEPVPIGHSYRIISLDGDLSGVGIGEADYAMQRMKEEGFLSIKHFSLLDYPNSIKAQKDRQLLSAYTSIDSGGIKLDAYIIEPEDKKRLESITKSFGIEFDKSSESLAISSLDSKNKKRVVLRQIEDWSIRFPKDWDGANQNTIFNCDGIAIGHYDYKVTREEGSVRVIALVTLNKTHFQ